MPPPHKNAWNSKISVTITMFANITSIMPMISPPGSPGSLDSPISGAGANISCTHTIESAKVTMLTAKITQAMINKALGLMPSSDAFFSRISPP